MALEDGTTVNPQITDAITQTNVKVVAEAPAMALGSLYQAMANSIAMAAANAVFSQQQANVTHQAATTMGVAKLLSIPITALTADEGGEKEAT
ncbi:MAG TPA: RebB protein [Blastocatellia bacterium]|nr:RebB protein [Blastocatellia bacterium]